METRLNRDLSFKVMLKMQSYKVKLIHNPLEWNDTKTHKQNSYHDKARLHKDKNT